MFELEKKRHKVFEFDLEKELKKDKAKTNQLQKHVDHQVHQLKNSLREGAKGLELDQYGELLQGYVALQKVLTRIANK